MYFTNKQAFFYRVGEFNGTCKLVLLYELQQGFCQDPGTFDDCCTRLIECYRILLYVPNVKLQGTDSPV